MVSCILAVSNLKQLMYEIVYDRAYICKLYLTLESQTQSLYTCKLLVLAPVLCTSMQGHAMKWTGLRLRIQVHSESKRFTNFGHANLISTS